MPFGQDFFQEIPCYTFRPSRPSPAMFRQCANLSCQRGQKFVGKVTAEFPSHHLQFQDVRQVLKQQHAPLNDEGRGRTLAESPRSLRADSTCTVLP